MQQACYALLCLAAAPLLSHPFNRMFYAAAMWFCAQIVDELMLGNLTSKEEWEYATFAVYALIVTYTIRKHDTQG